MFEYIKSFLLAEGIDRVGIVPLNECEIINERILPKDVNCAIIFCIPYRTSKKTSDDGFSEYARIYDYHKFSSSLYNKLSNAFPDAHGFCDHSPINEKLAAAKCGLGVIGRNSLFIDSVYGSYVFLGSILISEKIEYRHSDILKCIDCGKCIDACPNNAISEIGIIRSLCLSAISQKKNKTYEEKDILKEHHIAWGCDICQTVCPYNDKELSPVPYFKASRVEHIDIDFINSLSDDEFLKYAFSYKGRKIVIDNINLLT